MNKLLVLLKRVSFRDIIVLTRTHRLLESRKKDVSSRLVVHGINGECCSQFRVEELAYVYLLKFFGTSPVTNDFCGSFKRPFTLLENYGCHDITRSEFYG